MTQPITTVAIVSEADLVFLRQRTRRTAELLGFGAEDQTRIATAVSEIGRNPIYELAYGGRPLTVAHPGVGAIGYKGGMVDRPYLARAQALLALAARA